MDRRLEVIKATIILSAERGVHDTPMSEIYKKAGVSAGTIYHHFRSKDEFRVKEITEEQTTVSLVCGISGYEDAVTGSVHFWNSNGILDKEILELVHKLAADPETLNFKEDRMK